MLYPRNPFVGIVSLNYVSLVAIYQKSLRRRDIDIVNSIVSDWTRLDIAKDVHPDSSKIRIFNDVHDIFGNVSTRSM